MHRLKNVFTEDIVRRGRHNKPLNEFLAKATKAVREVFHGKVRYASLIWEQVDWNLFDFVGVDHYWDENSQISPQKKIRNFEEPYYYVAFIIYLKKKT